MANLKALTATQEKRVVLGIACLAYLGLLILNMLERTGFWAYATDLYTALAYLAIAVLVWRNIEHLDQFHVDRLSLWLLALSGTFLRRRAGIPGEIYFLPIIWLSSIAVFVALLRRRNGIPATNLRWVGWGFLLACLLLIPIAVVESLNIEYWRANDPFYRNMLVSVLRGLLSQLSFVAPLEELLFRGFLWGYLEVLGLSQKKAGLIQGVLFWLLHLASTTSPATFLISIPLTTFLVSFLTYRSRQTSPSIVAHATINTVGPLVVTQWLGQAL